MPGISAMTADFLAQKRIAVFGISRKQDSTAGLIYRKLKANGYQVYAIHPQAETFDGDPYYPDVKSTPERPDAAMIVTRPALTEQIVRDCAEAGVRWVWMHCSLMTAGASVSEAAVEFCRANGITVIPGGCPMMYYRPDLGHKLMRWMMRMTGSLPK